MTSMSSAPQLVHALATPEQLESSASRIDGISRELEDSVRFYALCSLQVAGVLLHIPQEIVAQAIVLLLRFWTGPQGGSMLDHDPIEVVSAALYLAAKPSATPVSPRQVLTCQKYIASLSIAQLLSTSSEHKDSTSLNVTDIDYDAARQRLYTVESHILHVLGFCTHVALPYTLCLNYLQALGVFQSDASELLAKATYTQLNSALLSPQQVHLTFPPSAIATAAIYLAARKVGIKLPDVEWWEIFDVDREELGFLVVALNSVPSFALKEQERWENREAPLTIAVLKSQMQRKQ